MYASEKFWFTEISPVINYVKSDPFSPNDVKPLIKQGELFSEGSLSNESPDEVINAIHIKGVWVAEDHNLLKITNDWLGTYTKDEIEAIEAGKPTPKAKKKEGEEEEPKRVEPIYFSRFLQNVSIAKKGKAKKGKTKKGKAKAASVYLGPGTIIKSKKTYDVGKLGSSFDMILPLKNPIVFKKGK